MANVKREINHLIANFPTFAVRHYVNVSKIKQFFSVFNDLVENSGELGQKYHLHFIYDGSQILFCFKPHDRSTFSSL